MQDVVLRIDESSGSKDGLEELSRLTAEFEHFVKDSNNDDVTNNNVSSHDFERKHNTDDQENRDGNVNGTETKTVLSTVETGEITDNDLTPVKHHAVEVVERESVQVVGKESEIEKSDIHENRHDEVFGENISKNENEETTCDIYLSENDEQIIVSRSLAITETSPPITELRIETIVHREETPDYIPLPVREKFHVLKIEENEFAEPEPVAESEKAKPEKSEPEKAPVISQERLFIREDLPEAMSSEMNQKLSSQGFVRVERPIEFYEPIETFIRRASISEIDEPPKPPERRRSVKDIIESINRNQKLLKINQNASDNEDIRSCERYSYQEKPVVPSKRNVNLKLQRQAEHEKSINRLLDDLNDFDKQNPRNDNPQRFPYDDDKPDVTFEKCNVKTDQENNSSTVNPIAKPRRVPDSKEWL